MPIDAISFQKICPFFLDSLHLRRRRRNAILRDNYCSMRLKKNKNNSALITRAKKSDIYTGWAVLRARSGFRPSFQNGKADPEQISALLNNIY